MRALFFVVQSLQLYAALRCQTLPKDIKKCRFGDSTCIVHTMNTVIRNFPKGIPAIGLKPIDVVDIKDTLIWDSARYSGVWFEFKLFNQVNYGFENTTITGIKGFDEDPTATSMEISGQIPSLIHKGRYNANGRILLMVMNATGESVSDFQNFRFTLKLKVVPEYRNNRRYLKIYELVPTVNLDRWIIWLDDFFFENTDLTIAINQVINDNWIEFWNELEPSILKTFTTVFTDMIENIFEKLPYDEMFIADGESN